MSGLGCVIIINCGAAVRGAAAGFAAYFAGAVNAEGSYIGAAATRLNVTNEELCRFAQVVLTAREPILISAEFGEEIEKLGDVALKLAAEMNAWLRVRKGANDIAAKLADRAMDLADQQCVLFGRLVSEYGQADAAVPVAREEYRYTVLHRHGQYEHCSEDGKMPNGHMDQFNTPIATMFPSSYGFSDQEHVTVRIA